MSARVLHKRNTQTRDLVLKLVSGTPSYGTWYFYFMFCVPESINQNFESGPNYEISEGYPILRSTAVSLHLVAVCWGNGTAVLQRVAAGSKCSSDEGCAPVPRITSGVCCFPAMPAL